MPDYGHEIEFGYFLVPDAGDPEGVRTFIEDVAPEVRERVAAARSGRPSVALEHPA